MIESVAYNLIEIVEPNEEQWAQIRPYVNISSSYGVDRTIFDSIEEMIASYKKGGKIVTLNGKAHWKQDSCVHTIEERIALYHKIIHLPKDKYGVASQTFWRETIIKKLNLNFNKSQIKYYDIRTHKIRNDKNIIDL